MIFLFRLMALLPLSVAHAMGWVLGWVVFVASISYRRRLIGHARAAGCSTLQWCRSVGHAGCMVAELPRLWMGPPVPVVWAGKHHIECALSQGQALLFLTPHLGSFEITAQAYAAHFGAHQPMTVLFRPARKSWLQALVAGARARPGLHTVPTSLRGVKAMMRALRSKQSVGLLPDQVPPAGQGSWLPFFGRPAYTMTLAERLARQSGVTVFGAWGERLPMGRGFRVHVQPVDLTATGLNAAIEGLILSCPQQYLWGYARYKLPISVPPVPQHAPEHLPEHAP
jgi:KDO2-lipid IV(A) lauroyltransferase